MPTYKNVTPTALYIDGKIVEPLGTIETYKLIDDNRLKKIADEPYFPLSYNNYEIEANGPGIIPEEGLSISQDCESLCIITAADVDVYANSLDNPYKLSLKNGWKITIENAEGIYKLFFDFKEAGKVIVYELPADQHL